MNDCVAPFVPSQEVITSFCLCCTLFLQGSILRVLQIAETMLTSLTPDLESLVESLVTDICDNAEVNTCLYNFTAMPFIF